MHLSGHLFATSNFRYGQRRTYYLECYSSWVVKIIADAIILRVEAIILRVEAIILRVDAIILRVDAIILRAIM